MELRGWIDRIRWRDPGSREARFSSWVRFGNFVGGCLSIEAPRFRRRSAMPPTLLRLCNGTTTQPPLQRLNFTRHSHLQ